MISPRLGASLLVPLVFLTVDCGVPSSTPAIGRIENPPVQPPEVEPEPAATTFVYRCDEGRFIARIEGGRVRLFLPGDEISLTRVPAAPGARFEGGGTVFWSKGEAALLEHRGQAYHGCINRPAEASWEDARGRGVDFRGRGNEPGWVLEMAPGTIVLVTAYGTRRLVFPAVQPDHGPGEKHTRYRTENGLHRLEIVLENRSCRDGMSGEMFETAVILELDARVFRDCGRSLP